MTNHCTFEQCQALKEIGFDMEVRDYYSIDKSVCEITYSWNWNRNGLFTSAPTRSEVLQWARENHGIDGWVRPQFDSRLLEMQVLSISYVGYYTKRLELFNRTNNYPTYPEAESSLVDKIIEIIKEQKV